MTDELIDNYSVYDGTLGFGQRPALILVDFVQGYFDTDCDLYAGAEAALASALRIRDAARVVGIPVVYSNVIYDKDGVDGGVFFRKVPLLHNFIAGNPMGDWAAGLQPADGEIVISKQYPSSFFGTSLEADLKALKVDTLIITGVTTSGCVRATCVDAMSHGFVPIVVKDACGDRHEGPHNANLFDMNAKYADVMSEEDVTKYLQVL